MATPSRALVGVAEHIVLAPPDACRSTRRDGPSAAHRLCPGMSTYEPGEG